MVEVTLRSGNLVEALLTVRTDASGRFRFVALPPGRYSVSTHREGFTDAARAGVDLLVGTTLTVDLELLPATLAVRLDVAEPPAPLVDVRTASASSDIDQRYLENLPTRRNVEGLINLAPGVTANVGFGGTQDSNGLYVDGVDITSVSLGNAYLHFNQNWLQEVEIVALGAGPEYGESTGVSANAVFRSGGNTSSGLFEALTTSPRWVARNTDDLSRELQRNFEPLQLLSWWDTSAQAGGPIVPNHLHYFAGVQRAFNQFRPAGYSGPGAQVVSDTRLLAKLNAALSNEMTVEGFLQQGHFKSEAEGLSTFFPLDAAYDYRQPQTTWNARAARAGGRTLLELRSGGYRSDSHQDPRPPATREGPAPHRDLATGVWSANTNFWFDGNRTRYTTAATLTHYREGPSGRHDIRAGLDFESSFMENHFGLPGGMSFTDDGGRPSSVQIWSGDSLEASSTRTGMFFSDNWEIGRVTVSPGARLDVHRVSIPLQDDVYATTPISPRLGVAWDVLESHRLVVRAHAGRYQDATFLGRISDTDVSRRAVRVTATVVAPGEYIETSRFTAGANSTIDPDVKHAYVDQFTSGVEWQALGDVAVQFNAIYRDFARMAGMVDTGRRWLPVERQDPGPDNLLGTNDDGEFLTVYNQVLGFPVAYLYTNPVDGVRRYRALQFVGRKRFSRNWQAQASYTWSRTDGSVSNASLTNTGVNDLGTGGAFTDPNRLINNEGLAMFDPREFKLLGVASIPRWGGVTLGAVYRYTSGQTWARRATFRNLNQGFSQIWMEPRGSRRLPAINNLDLRMEKLVALGRSLRLGISADVFNVTNQGVPNSDVSFPVSVDSGPFLGVPTAWVDPRLLRLGVRLTF